MADRPYYYAYVGARTTKRKRNASGNGLNVYRVDAESGIWTHIQLLPELVNPSFLAFDRSGRFLYTVHGDRSEVSAFAIQEETGLLTFLAEQNTEGKNPVHLSFDPTNQFLVVANHASSSVALLPRNADGSLDTVVDLVMPHGEIGPHRVEQRRAGPHQVEFDRSGAFVVVPDKGLDAVFSYSIDALHRKLVPAAAPLVSREVSGPRHIAFHSNERWAYVINELACSVTSCIYDPATGALDPFQILPSIPETFTGNSRAAGIVVSADGRFLYASNRGHDSIVAYNISPASGRLSDPSWTSTGGRTPRFFALDPTGRFLFAANEESHTIATIAVDQESGRLSALEQVIDCGSPVSIVFKSP